MSEGTNSTTTSSWLVDIVDAAAGNGSGNYQDYYYYGYLFDYDLDFELTFDKIAYYYEGIASETHIGIGFATFFLNFYIVATIFAVEELRSVDFYPIGMQCSCDLLTGIVSSWNALQTLLRRQSFSGSGLIYSGSLASWLRSIKYFDNDLLTLIVTHEVNYMMSGYCILIIAVERYILVCHPFRANQLLSKQNRWKFSTVLTLFVLMCIIRETLCLRSLQYCLFFLKLWTIETSTRAIVFFIFPAAVTCLLYLLVGLRLSKAQSNKDRNRDLNVAFSLSCVLWIILWLPKTARDVLSPWMPVTTRIGLQSKSRIERVTYSFELIATDLFLLNPFINPLIFIFISRGFQKPLIKLYRKVASKNEEEVARNN